MRFMGLPRLQPFRILKPHLTMNLNKFAWMIHWILAMFIVARGSGELKAHPQLDLSAAEGRARLERIKA
jgi:hypothetical protein